MPWGDRTGPSGYGPMTGRGAGYCAGYDMPGYMNPYVPRMGMGWGRGFGRGRGGGGRGGRGFGRGFGGRGRGGFWRRWDPEPYPAPYYEPGPYYGPDYGAPYPEPAPEEEKTYLENVVKGLEEELKVVKDRLKGLAKKSKE